MNDAQTRATELLEALMEIQQLCIDYGSSVPTSHVHRIIAKVILPPNPAALPKYFVPPQT